MLKGFDPVVFSTEIVHGEDSSVTLIPLTENVDFRSLTKKPLTLLAFYIPFFGDNEEV